MNFNYQESLTRIAKAYNIEALVRPVSPATKEAWVLHLADMLSARLDDCDRYDKF